MKGFSYRERNHDFGEAILSLRSAIGLTQAGMAKYLSVSRKTVGEWEGGVTYPKTEHLKKLITLALEQKAFTVGHEEEEIRALWHASHQKVLLDEAWLDTVVAHTQIPKTLPSYKETPSVPPLPSSPTINQSRVDWYDAPSLPSFYGRDWEINLLSSWLLSERCRVVSVLGLGGIGKSALAVYMMHLLSTHFSFVIWRSLRDAPSCDALLNDLLLLLSPQTPRDPSVSFDLRISLLLDALRQSRVLLIFDNLETVLDDGPRAGHFRSDFLPYTRLLRSLAETDHQSCLLLTSRQKPADLIPLEGNRAPVRILRLARLGSGACEQILNEQGIQGSPSDHAQLIEAYAGNPLALKIVSQTILDLFDGAIAPFLQQGQVVFGGVRDLLNEQYALLSPLEQTVLFWLAIIREPITLRELRSLLATPQSPGDLLDALEGLRRRSLIEHGHLQGSFTLQSVIQEYLTSRLVDEACYEIEHGSLLRLLTHSFVLASSSDYIRLAQERLLVSPILARLRASQYIDLDVHLLDLLDQLRHQDDYVQGYGPANLLVLLRLHRGHLRDLDLSLLSIRSAYLQGVEMQDTTLAGAMIRETTFTEAFDAINGVAVSSDGKYWAAASRSGQMRIWDAGGQTLHRVWQGHTERVWSLTFSPDGRTLISGSWDGLVKQWDVVSGTLIWSGRHTGNINGVSFAPDGEMLASGGAHKTVLWHIKSGTQAQILAHPDLVIAVEWSPRGDILATGDIEGHIRLWKVDETGPAICLQTITGHTNLISGLAFSPDGNTLASASYDSSVKLWDIGRRELVQTLTGHKERVHRVAWSPDGRLLASGGYEKMIWLWNVEQGRYQGTLQGHTDSVIDLAFTPDSRNLISSGDSTLRQWDIDSGRCIRVLQGNVEALFDVDWSPDGTQLVSGGSDKLVTISDRAAETSSRVLRGHGGLVFGVGWSPNGTKLASSSWDATVRLWDPTTGAGLQVLRAADDTTTFFCGLAWSPDGRRLAGTTYLNPLGVLVWDGALGSHVWQSLGYPTPIRRIAWSPDGMQLAGGGDNGTLYLWDANSGTLLKQFSEHKGPIKSVAWSPDGRKLVSASSDSEGGELFVWDILRGEHISTITSHPGLIYAVVWDPKGGQIITGGSDGMLRWWDAHSGENRWAHKGHQGTVQSLRCSPDGTQLASCGDDGAIILWDLDSGTMLQTLRRDRPYERLQITGVKGLSQAQRETLRALGAIEDTNTSN